MTDIALENAVAARDDMAKKIAAAEEQIKEWRAKIQRAERFIADWEEFSGQKVRAATVQNGGAKPESSTRSKPQNPKKEEVAEVACQIIRENGEPMTRDELFAALPERGITIHGQNPAVVLQTMLWRMKDRIVHLKGHGYWPREDAYMAADYEVGGDEPAGDAADDLDDETKSVI